METITKKEDMSVEIKKIIDMVSEDIDLFEYLSKTKNLKLIIF